MVFSSKLYIATNTQGIVIKIMITDRAKADCKVAFALIKDIKTDILVANCAYNTNDTFECAKKRHRS